MQYTEVNALPVLEAGQDSDAQGPGFPLVAQARALLCFCPRGTTARARKRTGTSFK